MDLNGRELASLIWLGFFLALALATPGARSSLGQILRMSGQWKIFLPAVALTGYAAGVVVVTWRLGWWTPSLLKDTLVWFVGTALAALLNLKRAMEDRGFYRHAVLQAVTLSAMLQFLAGLYPFSVYIEVPLQGVLMLLVGVTVVAQRHESSRPAGTFAQSILSLLGVVILVASVVKAVEAWRDLSLIGLLRQFALPLWATLAVLPFLYLFALIAAYELQHTRMTFVQTVDGSPTYPGQALVALIVGANIRLRRVVELTHQGRREMTLAGSLRERLGAYRRDRARLAGEMG